MNNHICITYIKANTGDKPLPDINLKRIQKVADLSAGFTGYVWTKAASGKKKLRIKKYPDTCGLGLMDIERKTIIIAIPYG